MKSFFEKKWTKWVLIGVVALLLVALVAFGIHAAGALRSQDDDPAGSTPSDTVLECAHSETYVTTEYVYEGHLNKKLCCSCDFVLETTLLKHSFEDRVCVDTSCGYVCNHSYVATDKYGKELFFKDENITFTSESDSAHIVSSYANVQCTNCGFSGTYVEEHIYGDHEVCVACSHKCLHSNGDVIYNAYKENGAVQQYVHAKRYGCPDCGYSSVEKQNCTYDYTSSKCTVCSITCPHTWQMNRYFYSEVTEGQHKETMICDACKKVLYSETQDHYYQDSICPCGVACGCANFEEIAIYHDWTKETGVHLVDLQCQDCGATYLGQPNGTRTSITCVAGDCYFNGCSECAATSDFDGSLSCGFCTYCGHYAADSVHAQTPVGNKCPVCGFVVKEREE